MRENVTEYLNIIPEEIRDAISELSGDQRWAVFLAIFKNDRTFNKLKTELEISAEQLDNILRRLVIGGLVYKEMASPADIGERKKTKYTITPLGKKIVQLLSEGMLPKVVHPEISEKMIEEFSHFRGTADELISTIARYRYIKALKAKQKKSYKIGDSLSRLAFTAAINSDAYTETEAIIKELTGEDVTLVVSDDGKIEMIFEAGKQLKGAKISH